MLTFTRPSSDVGLSGTLVPEQSAAAHPDKCNPIMSAEAATNWSGSGSFWPITELGNGGSEECLESRASPEDRPDRKMRSIDRLSNTGRKQRQTGVVQEATGGLGELRIVRGNTGVLN